MKRTLLSLLVLFSVGSASAAAATPVATEIAASGTGSVALAPDLATVNAAVETTSENASDAIAQNNAIYDRIVGALLKLGIARNDVALAYYNIRYNPRPNPMPPNPTNEQYGYTVSRNFTVKVRAIGKAGTVSDACIGAGATGISGVDFGLSNPNVARARAIGEAVADARTNAEALARAAGLHVVAIKSIELGGGGPGPVPLMRVANAANPTQFDQSNVNVSVSVNVVFLAER
jgi:uncharacterized protein